MELREQPSDGKQLSRSVQRALFSLRISPSLLCEFPSGELTNLWGPIYSISRAPRKPPSPSDSISLLTLYMWAPDIYEGSPTPVTAFLSIAPKISISANMSRVSIVASYGGTLQQIFFFCSIASMILGALAAMAQTKVKRPLAHSSIGHRLYSYWFLMWNHRRNSITTNWYIYLCINDDRCIRHSSSITANPCQIYSGFGRSSQNESYFGYDLLHYNVLIRRNTPVSRLL